ncbi:MAG TPA: metallophosphoesterase [Planctomycetota bacterium]|jgi:3',5'-cyclic AMP phosphodiesterase CpdA
MAGKKPTFLIVALWQALLAAICCAKEAQAVLPEGEAPLDPKPLMAKVRERVAVDKFRFAVLGDTKHAKTFPALLKYLDEVVKPDFVLSTGDMVVIGGGKAGLTSWKRLATESGAEFRKRPWWPVIGNHELLGGTAVKHAADEDDDDEHKGVNPAEIETIDRFREFYNLEREYYSFEFRNSYFIALPYPQPKDESKKWLENELKKAAAAKKHIFVFNHMPFYTVGKKLPTFVPNTETTITKLFDEYSVCAVFSGHDHIYYRTIRKGVTYVISAGGGATLYPLSRMKEALPEDVYYGGDPVSFAPQASATKDKTATKDKPAASTQPAPKKKYLLHNGATGTPDKFTEQPSQYMVVVDVEGTSAKMTCVTSAGEQWDEVKLTK